jgi:sRNA-binding carbon storage regulator CsrA
MLILTRYREERIVIALDDGPAYVWPTRYAGDYACFAIQAPRSVRIVREEAAADLAGPQFPLPGDGIMFIRRKLGQRVLLLLPGGLQVAVSAQEIRGKPPRLRIGLEADGAVPIWREEIWRTFPAPSEAIT